MFAPMFAPILFVLAAAPAAPAPTPDAELTARLTGRLDQLAAERRFSGELRISRGDQLIIHRGFGGVTVDPSRPGVYVVASNTKTFTAAAVLLLAQRGRLKLDDSLSRHIPEVDPKRLTLNGRAVTLDDLLTHTSGLTGMDLQPLWASSHPPDVVVRLLSQAHLATTPGREFDYCNECYVVLGEVIRRVSGRPYDQFIRDNVTTPLGLVDTALVPGDDQRRRLLPGQVGSEMGLHPARRLMPHRLREAYEWPGAADGGMRSTAPDLERFMTALLGERLLDRAHRELMFTEKLASNGRGVVNSPGGPGRRLIWHDGELKPLGYQSFAGLLIGPDDGPPLSMVVLANVDSSALDVTAEVIGALSGRPPPPFQRWTFERTMNTLRALRLGPLLATLALAWLLWQRRRPALSRAHTLTLAATVVMLVAIGLAGARTVVFAGSLLFTLIAAAADLRRPPSQKWSWADPACQATPVALLFALAVVAVVLLMRWPSG